MARVFFLLLSLWATCLSAGQDTAKQSGTFQQTRYLPEHDVTLETAGAFALWPGEGLIWDTQTPFASTLIVSGDGLYQMDPDGGFSALDAGRGGLELTILDKMLSGDPQALIDAGIFTLVEEVRLPSGETRIRGTMKTLSGKDEPVSLRISDGPAPALKEIVFWGRDEQGQDYQASKVTFDLVAADQADLSVLWHQFQEAR